MLCPLFPIILDRHEIIWDFDCGICDSWRIQFFFLLGFPFTDTDDLQDSREREETIFWFHFTTSIRSRTFRHLFATLHVRWLSRIFNRNACVYQTATWWDLPPYRITIWLIDDLLLIFVLVLQANRLTKRKKINPKHWAKGKLE